MSDKLVYLISGANRGIGLGLVETALAASPNAIVYAGVRDPNSADKLNQVAKENSGRVHVVKLQSYNEADAKAVAAQIKKDVGYLDIVVANAGIARNDTPDIINSDIKHFEEQFHVNSLGPLVLYRAIRDLLLASPTKAGKFVPISSMVGCLSVPLPAVMTSYGTSKAAINFITFKIALHEEKTDIIAFPMHPGHVQTDMGNAGAVAFGLKEAPVTLKDSVTGILNVITNAKKDVQPGKMWDFEGKEMPF